MCVYEQSEGVERSEETFGSQFFLSPMASKGQNQAVRLMQQAL